MADRRDAEHQALAEAEGRLFADLGLEHRSHRVGLEHAPVVAARIVETGTGPPVLFVHGAGMSAAVWAPLLPHLPHRRCIAVDLPGCGLTDPFDYRGVDLREQARSFLTAVLAALGLDAAPAVANSLGATFGLYLATAEPSRMSKLVLVGCDGGRAAGRTCQCCHAHVQPAGRGPPALNALPADPAQPWHACSPRSAESNLSTGSQTRCSTPWPWRCD